jgi:hypothetical protein
LTGQTETTPAPFKKNEISIDFKPSLWFLFSFGNIGERSYSQDFLVNYRRSLTKNSNFKVAAGGATFDGNTYSNTNRSSYYGYSTQNTSLMLRTGYEHVFTFNKRLSMYIGIDAFYNEKHIRTKDLSYYAGPVLESEKISIYGLAYTTGLNWHLTERLRLRIESCFMSYFSERLSRYKNSVFENGQLVHYVRKEYDRKVSNFSSYPMQLQLGFTF